ncbi:small ribosomal subunit protein mS31 isoform X2 [Narcine bancroftii]|uniref:small ribosomal subunit protein mS31 isoform X2 n=1 Tax=Narcine bancroftii TaxID=1343680 RepID=UPI0038311094
MRRAAMLVFNRGTARPAIRAPGEETAGRRLSWRLLNGTGRRLIVTGSAMLRNDDETLHAASPEQKESTEKKEAAAQGKNDLLNIIGGMKVDISSKRKFQALRREQLREKTNAEPESMESTTSMFQKATKNIENQCYKTLNPDLVTAASAVASSMPHSKGQIESELLKQLRKHESETEVQKNGGVSNIGDLIASMKIGKHSGARSGSRAASQIRFDEDGQGYVPHQGVSREFNALRKRRGLYAEKKLNIFPAQIESESVPETVTQPSLWDTELANQIATVSEQLPRNGFEEMIQYTKEGKLWQFPVNNEDLKKRKAWNSMNTYFWRSICMDSQRKDRYAIS